MGKSARKAVRQGKAIYVHFHGADKVAQCAAAVAQAMRQWDEAAGEAVNAQALKEAARAELQEVVRQASDAGIVVEPSKGGKITQEKMPVRFAINEALKDALPHVAEGTRKNYLGVIARAINDRPHVIPGDMNAHRAASNKRKHKGAGGPDPFLRKTKTTFSINARSDTTGAQYVKAFNQLAAFMKGSKDKGVLALSGYLIDASDVLAEVKD